MTTAIHPRATAEAQDRAIVAPEAYSAAPSQGDAEKMARRRFQDPKPKRVGNWWYLLIRQDEIREGRRERRRKRLKLAPATMPEREVRKIAAEILRPMNQGLLTVGSATTLETYINDTYREVVLPLMASSTRDRYEGVIKNHLMPTFGRLCLRDLTPLAVQKFLTGMAKSELSHESRDKIRDVLSSILGSAVEYGLLVKNPVDGLRLPPDKRGKRVKPYIAPDRFAALIELIAEPYSTMVFVAVYTGLRVSELVGLRWGDIHEHSITIDERYCRGDWGEPKSDASNTTIPVNTMVIERIHRLRTLTVEVKAGTATRRYKVVKSDGPDDLVFQSVKSGRPMRDNNILTRHIKPAARKLGMPWVNWLVLRRSFATWLKLSGADIKDAQGLMRHSRATTTLDVYQQFVPESQSRAVERLSALTQKGLVN
jgi:integrase